nr:hypothetical protein [uncultured Methanoregula sp.]
MKPAVTKSKLVAIISILVIIGIACGILTCIMISPSKDLRTPFIPGLIGQPVPEKKIIDITIEVDEYNLSFIHNRTLVSVTYDEVSVYPDLEMAMHGVTNDPNAWNYGHRVVKWLEGNESDIHRFYLAACGNRTWDDCYPNPPIYEYHGQYYMISYDRIGSHTVGSCERGNYNCTGSEKQDDPTVIPLPPVRKGDQFLFTRQIPVKDVPEARVWLMGNQYLTIETVPVRFDGSIDYSLNTTNVPPGRYYILIQVPATDARYDIIFDNQSGSGTLYNIKKTGIYGNGGESHGIFTFHVARTMDARTLLNTMLQEFNAPGVSDTAFSYSLEITNPFIRIDSDSSYATGKNITINGTTNFPANSLLLVQCRPQEITMDSPAFFSTVSVAPGKDQNHWSVTLDSSQFAGGRYVISVKPADATSAYEQFAAFSIIPQQSTMK